jgi:membrane protease YdiL (CAAX protease family)
LLAILLLTYGNGKAWILGDAPAGSLLGVGFGVALVVLMAAWARVARLDRAELGVSRSTLLRSGIIAALLVLVIGAAASIAVVLVGPGHLATFFPASLRALPAEVVVRRVAILLPVDTVISEELAFCGVLQAELRRLLPMYPAILLTALVFALWHVVITLGETSPSEPLLVLGKLAGIGAFGLGFGVLREKTGNLLGGAIVHWTSDAAGMLLPVLLFQHRWE